MPPAIPIATYRLQFTPEFGFDDAARSCLISRRSASATSMPRRFSRRAPAARTATTSSTITRSIPELGGEEASLG